jgi:hypothetical protein
MTRHNAAAYHVGGMELRGTFLGGDAILTIVARDGAKMNSVNVATAWHRLAKISQRGAWGSGARADSPDVARALREDVRMAHLEHLSEKFAKDFDAMNLTNIAWSCAVLRYRPAGSILSHVCDKVTARAHQGLVGAQYPVSQSKVGRCRWTP